MSATSFYTDPQNDDDILSLDSLNIDLSLDEDITDLDFEEENSKSSQNKRFTTDLVRLYLQDIGRVPLLEKDQEVSIAQKVQNYNHLRKLRVKTAKKGDRLMQQFVELIEVHDRLASHQGSRPSLTKWSEAAGMDVATLKEVLAKGKEHWAEIAGISVQELDKIQKIGVRAKDQMIKANLRLVVSVAKKYQNRGLELLDLIQEGTLGLERAVDKFDPTKGYRFSTYAYWWIRQGITRAIATQSRTIRIPVHITEKLNKIKKAQRQLSQEKGKTASIEDVAKELDMTPDQVREVLRKVPKSVSLEIKVGKEKDTELGDLLETEIASPEETLMREALHKDLHNLLADLSSRERDVIELRFGLTDGTSYSLAEIGRILELSRERVRQIEAKALQKLRQPKRRNRIRDYLEVLG